MSCSTPDFRERFADVIDLLPLRSDAAPSHPFSLFLSLRIHISDHQCRAFNSHGFSPAVDRLWKECREGRRCSRDTHPESYIPRDASVRRRSRFGPCSRDTYPESYITKDTSVRRSSKFGPICDVTSTWSFDTPECPRGGQELFRGSHFVPEPPRFRAGF